MVRGRLFSMCAALLAAPLPSLAQPVGPAAPPPSPAVTAGPPISTAIQPGDDTAIGPQAPRPGQENCRRTPSESGEIVVCGEGRGSENSAFRIPRQFRGMVSHDDADASLAARTRDMDSMERYANQTSGPSAYLNRSAQQRCEWVAERQIAQGRRPDCTRRNRQNQAADYTRGIPQARD